LPLSLSQMILLRDLFFGSGFTTAWAITEVGGPRFGGAA
jgi:hypothetical protein